MRLGAQHVEETRHIPAVGDLVLAGDVQQSAQGWVAVQFGQASVEGGMAQGDGQQDDTPETFDGVVIAAVAAGSAEAGEQRLIGDGVEEVADGNEGGAIVEAAPSEQGLCGVDVHGEISGEKPHRGYQRKGSPRKVSSGGKIVKKGKPRRVDSEKTVSRWGKTFSPHSSHSRKTRVRQQRIRLLFG